MEITTHTASHYNSDSLGLSAERFCKGIKIAKKIVGRDDLKSSLKTCRAMRFMCTVCEEAGNTVIFFGDKGLKGRLGRRICRLVDSYIKFNKQTVYPIFEVNEDNRFNIRASRFLRSYTPTFSLFEWLKLGRIKREMTLVAKVGLPYMVAS